MSKELRGESRTDGSTYKGSKDSRTSRHFEFVKLVEEQRNYDGPVAAIGRGGQNGASISLFPRSNLKFVGFQQKVTFFGQKMRTSEKSQYKQ